LTNVPFVCLKNSLYLILKIFLKIIMVSIHFCPPPAHRLQTSETVLDCKLFQQSMSGFPSDRHAYHLKCFMHPMRYCFSSSSSFYKFFISVQTYIFYVQQGTVSLSNQEFHEMHKVRSLPFSLLNF
jgi:hypothetical protein